MVIPDTLGGYPVTIIGDRAFYGCSSLTEIKIPEGVTSIGGYAFYGCSSLTEIIIPEGVIRISYEAFRGCNSLVEIKIPESVTNIGRAAFYGCSSLTEIEIPESVTSIDIEAFTGCSSLIRIDVNERNVKYSSKGGVIFNKEKTIIMKYPAKKEGVEYIIPSTVTSINMDAFQGCSSLVEIEIPEGVTYIGGRAFWGCSNLTKIKIPEGVTSINESAFSGCSSLVEIEIPEGVTNIGIYAFWRCSSLTEIKIPNSVTDIRIHAFGDCTSLTEIIIPEGVTSIEDSTFYGCSSLTNIEIPESVTEIKSNAFFECRSLAEIKIPEGVTSIGTSAFSYCTSLTEIEIPERVTSIGISAFSGCSSLVEIKIPEGVTSIGNYAFFRCSSLTEIIIPKSVTNIGTNAFGSVSNNFKIYCFKNSYAETYAQENSIPYEYIILDSITIKTSPTKTEYNIGENFDSAGMKIVGTYKYGEETIEYDIPKESYSIVPSGELAYGTTKVTISYTENEITKTVEQAITVKDNIKPTIKNITGNPTSWTNQNITITVNAEDIGSGIAEYSFNDGANWQTENTKEFNTNQTVKIKVKDNAGNVSEITTVEINKIDKTKPTIQISPNGGAKATKRNITITAGDLGGSGLKSNNQYQYQLSTNNTTAPTGEWQTYTSGQSFEIGEGLTGEYYLWIKTIEDNSGNKSEETMAGYTISNKYTFDVTADPLKIESEKYEIKDNYITNIEEKLTKTDFLKNIQTNAETIKITKEGKEIEASEKIATGMELTIAKNGEEETYTLVVKGDTNGDGQVNFFDITKLISIVYDKPNNIEESVKKAGICSKTNTSDNPGFFDITSLITYVYDTKQW